MKPSGILETVLYAKDLDAAKAFYGRLLGLEIVLENAGSLVFFRCGEGMLLIFNPEASRTPTKPGELPVPRHGAEGPGHMCFKAPGGELEAWRTRLPELGIEIEQEIEWPTGAKSIYVRDPASNSVEFAEPKLWGLE